MSDISVPELIKKVAWVVNDDNNKTYEPLVDMVPNINAGARYIRSLRPDACQDSNGDDRNYTAVTGVTGDMSLDDKFIECLTDFVAARCCQRDGQQIGMRQRADMHMASFAALVRL